MRVAFVAEGQELPEDMKMDRQGEPVWFEIKELDPDSRGNPRWRISYVAGTA